MTEALSGEGVLILRHRGGRGDGTNNVDRECDHKGNGSGDGCTETGVIEVCGDDITNNIHEE